MNVCMRALKLKGNYIFWPLQLSLSVKLSFDGQECLHGFVKDVEQQEYESSLIAANMKPFQN